MWGRGACWSLLAFSLRGRALPRPMLAKKQRERGAWPDQADMWRFPAVTQSSADMGLACSSVCLCYTHTQVYMHKKVCVDLGECCPSLWCVCAKSLQPCPTLCDPMDCSTPGSSVHGILQSRIQGWIAIPFSRGSSSARD